MMSPIDKFLDEFELLKRRSKPDERIPERNLAVASKFMDRLKSDELKAIVATTLPCQRTLYPRPMICA